MNALPITQPFTQYFLPMLMVANLATITITHNNAIGHYTDDTIPLRSIHFFPTIVFEPFLLLSTIIGTIYE